MDFRAKKDLPNPRETASVISRLFFLWIVPLFRKGSGKDLTIDDMYNVPHEDISHELGLRLGKEWERKRVFAEKNGTQPKFFKTLTAIFGKNYIFLGIALLFDECVIRVAQPIFLKRLIRSFSGHSTSDSEQYICAAGICLTSLLHAVIIHPLAFAILHIGMKCRLSSCSLIYRKTLRLSNAAQEETTVGQLINLLSNDVNRFDMNLLFIPYLIIGPIQTIIFVYFLWEELGISCLIGVGFVFALMPVQYYLGTVSRNLRFKIAQKSDERGRIMNEIIMAIRVIKQYAWELPFSSMINSIRREEVKVLKKRAYLRSFYLSLFLSSKNLIPYLTILAYVLFGHTLTADKVFFAVPIFDVIIYNMVSTLPSAAAGFGELIVSIKRIERFLLLEEMPSKYLGSSSDKNENVIPCQENILPVVKFSNVIASWNKDKYHLDHVNVNLSGSKLVMVVGHVGCGKTSFLQALLSEMPISSGKLYVDGRISYCSQDPWIFSGNIRQNILFGLKYDEERYEEIVNVCALTDDLFQLPQGDMSLVGERGIALSGGQKARINLARALYKEADIYLLDDPLSAVDSRVSQHIFNKCTKKYLDGSLRILVSHQLHYLPMADHVIVMKRGEIIAQGTYEELVSRNIDFVNIIIGEKEVDLYRKASITRLETIEDEIKKEKETQDSNEEKMAVGSVSVQTYWEYFRSGDSPIGMFFVFLGFILSQILFSASDYWLKHWTTKEESYSSKLNYIRHSGNETESAKNDTIEYPTADSLIGDMPSLYDGRNGDIATYSALIALIIFATNINSAYFFRYCMRISVNIHNKMFGSLVHAPVKFYDDNPSGRMMNRFTKDICAIDESLPSACFDVITIFLAMLGVIGIVIYSNIYAIAPSVLMVVALWLIRRFYIQTARDVKRIEAITRSPLFTHLTASVQGLTTIRASGRQNVLIRQFDAHQDNHSAAWFLFISSNRWFGIWLEMISVTFLTIVIFSFFVITNSVDSSGNVGLAISSVLSVTFKFQWGMRQSAEIENLMTSVERCLEYTKVKPEASLKSTDEKRPSKNWPSDGAVKFSDVCLAYEDKEVLKNLSFEINPRENIGIVGRTGAGKSSIISALFRLTEPEGSIVVDGVKITEIGLHDLRKNISIIPQDPVLFSGSIRYNLDPFGQYPDEDLWEVLKEVNLSEEVPALDFKVNDGGSNFSVGQRQLVCLARAVLRKNRIIVMDEATANVDHRTDEFIQETIRKKFKDCTIITIAHRLHSVMDCDKILVLRTGSLVEFDHPHVLLSDPESVLSSMARHTGRSSNAHLKKIAEAAFRRNQDLKGSRASSIV